MKSKIKAQHTPTPWKADRNEIIAVNKHETLIADVFDENKDWQANAAFIVRAVNSHEELLSALKTEHNVWDIPGHDKETCQTCALIAKADGK